MDGVVAEQLLLATGLSSRARLARGRLVVSDVTAAADGDAVVDGDALFIAVSDADLAFDSLTNDVVMPLLLSVLADFVACG